MAAVAVIAIDCAALRPVFPMDFGVFHTLFVRQTLPTFPNFGLVAMVLLLEIGLYRAVSRRGMERAFWLGFEAGGWAYVIRNVVWSVSRRIIGRILPAAPPSVRHRAPAGIPRQLCA